MALFVGLNEVSLVSRMLAVMCRSTGLLRSFIPSWKTLGVGEIFVMCSFYSEI